MFYALSKLFLSSGLDHDGKRLVIRHLILNIRQYCFLLFLHNKIVGESSFGFFLTDPPRFPTKNYLFPFSIIYNHIPFRSMTHFPFCLSLMSNSKD